MTPIGPATTAARPLVVRIRNWVGDVVLGLPALQLLQSQGYALQIVGRGKWAPALLAGYGWPVHVQPKTLAEKVAQLKAIRRECAWLDAGFARRENALLLPVSLSSAVEMRLAGLKAVGVAKEGRSPLLARAEPWATSGHELTRYWDIACRFLGIEAKPPLDIGFIVQPAKAMQIDTLLATHGIDDADRGFAMICPFAGGRAATADKADKKWPGFIDFAARAEAALGMPLLLYPGPGEHADARRLYPAARCIEGGDLAIYAALLQRARVVVANDTGPAHMAAALGRPLISVLGATDAARWAPWGPRVHVAQRPRQGDEVTWPEVDEVLELAARLLREQA